MTKNKNNLKQKMIEQKINPKEWVTLQEAAKKSIYSKKQIGKLAEKGNERIGTFKIDNTIFYNLRHILEYAANHQQDTILSPVWDGLTFHPGEYFYPIIGYDGKYCISNECRVFNFSSGQILTPQKQQDIKGKLTGYSTVGLMKNGKTKNVFVHKLVGETQCPNAFKYVIFHHINAKKIDDLYVNKASNLLPIPNEEIHAKLHKLMKTSKEEYIKMVEQIRKNNKQKLFSIPHLDFASNEHLKYLMLVNEKGYNAYKKSGNVPLDCIMGEKAEKVEFKQ